MIPVFIVCGKLPKQSEGGGYSTVTLSLKKTLEDLGCDVHLIGLPVKMTALPLLPVTAPFLAKKIERRSRGKPCIIWGIGPWAYVGALVKKKHPERVTLITSMFSTIRHEWQANKIALHWYEALTRYKLAIAGIIIPFIAHCEKQGLKYADRIVVNYNSTAKILKNEYKISGDRITKIHWNLPVRNKRHPHDRTYILCVARQDTRKGIPILLRALVGLRIPVIIVGAGLLLKDHKRLAQKLGCTNVHFTGYLADYTKHLQNASLFCLPTLEEGAGSVAVCEAIAAGIPVVASNIDGIPEDVDRSNGYLVPLNNPKALRKAIVKLWNHPLRVSNTWNRRHTPSQTRRDIARLITTF